MNATPSSGQIDHSGEGGQRRLSIVIVTFNSAASLPPLLDSIPAGLENVTNFDVIVVDNDSVDGSPELAEAHRLRPMVIRMGRNAGYAAAINAAAATVPEGSDLLVLNPDLRLYPQAVAPLMETAEWQSVGIVVPRNYTMDGSTDPTLRREPSILTAWAEAIFGGSLAARLGWGEVIGDEGRYECYGPVEWASGSALLLAARARRAVGRWEERFFLYSEEVDYQRRVREAGFDIVYEPRARVMHEGGQSGSDPRLFTLLTANRIRYYASHHGRLASFVFRLGVAAGLVLRSTFSLPHRAALRGALTPARPAEEFMAGQK